MPLGVSSSVASLAVWSLLVFAAVQLYAAFALVRGQDRRLARGLLAALFATNGMLTAVALVFRLTGAEQPLLARIADDATNGLLVLAAEASALAILGKPSSLSRWAFAGTAAAMVAVIPAATKVGAIEGPVVFTLAAYAYAATRLTHAWWRAPASSVHARWAGWLVLAFLPRAVEFGVGYAYPITDAWSWLSPLQLGAAVLLMGLGVAAVALALRRSDRLGPVLFALVASGFALGVARYPGLSVPSLVAEPLVVYFTLALVRPAAVLLGLQRDGLLGAAVDAQTMTRHVLLMAGVAGVFAVGMTLVPALVDARGAPFLLFVVAALALATSPLWLWLADRVAIGTRSPPAEPAAAPPAALPAPSDRARPGLDPACRFLPEHLAWYDDAARRAATLDEGTRARLASLTRPERVLLALRGTSAATRGRWEYTQAGLQLATHIPYRHLRAAVEALNDGGQGRLVETTVGVRGIRHYHLTPAGNAASDRLANQTSGYGGPDARAVLGEAFYATLRPTPPREPAPGLRRTPPTR